MKKLFSIIATFTCAFCFAMNVNASNLEGKINISDGVGIVSGQEVTYDSVNDVNIVKINVTLTTDKLNQMLNQAPGNTMSPAPKASYFITVNPGLGTGSFQKQNVSTTGDIVADKASVDNKIDTTTEATTSYSTVWLNAFNFDYKDNNGQWAQIRGTTTGTETIAQHIADAAGISVNDLSYGENFRSWSWNDTNANNTLYAWEYTNDEGNVVREYIETIVIASFPVSWNLSGYIYPTFGYATVDEAINSILTGFEGASNIVVNQNATVESNVTLPNGAKLVINSGATLTVNNGVSLTNNGTIINNGTIRGSVLGSNSADYSKVDEAKLAYQAVERTKYTDESLASLDEAYGKIVLDKPITEQALVDSYADMINLAIKSLVEKGADYRAVLAAIDLIESDLSVYTTSSVTALNNAKNAVIYGKKISEQAIVDGYADAIVNAINNLVVKNANYKVVENAIAKVPNDLSIYTSASVANLNDAINAVDYSLNAKQQNIVNNYAQDIEDMLAALVEKSADYTVVDNVIGGIPSDLSIYTNDSITTLNNAINNVIRGKKISEQAVVDGYAVSIETAIKTLVEKPADYSIVDNAIDSIPSNLSIYTDDTLAILNKAKGNVVRGLPISKQAIVNGYANAINDAVLGLVEKTANYSSVYTAIKNIPSDLSIYTDSSVIALINAKSSVRWGLPISKQEIVIGYANAINNAVLGLVEKPIAIVVVVDTSKEVDDVTLGVSDKDTSEKILLDSLNSSQFKGIDNLSVSLDITSGKNFSVGKTAKSKIENAIDGGLKNANIIEFFDITLNVINNVNGQKIGKLAEINHPLSLSIVLPKEYRSVKKGYTRKYYVLRYHNGKVDILEARLDKNGKTLLFESDKYSTYALAYLDVANNGSNGTGNEEVTPPNTGVEISSNILLLIISIIGIVSISLVCVKRREN